MELADVGTALVLPLVRVGLVLVENRRPAVPDLGEHLIDGGRAVEAADGLLGQASLAHDRLDALGAPRPSTYCRPARHNQMEKVQSRTVVALFWISCMRLRRLWYCRPLLRLGQLNCHSIRRVENVH